MTPTFAVRLMTTSRTIDPVTRRRPCHERWIKIEAKSADEAATAAIATTTVETGIVRVRGVTMWDPEIHEKKSDVAPIETPSAAESSPGGYIAKSVGFGNWGVFDSQGIRQNRGTKMDEDTAKMLADALNGREAAA